MLERIIEQTKQFLESMPKSQRKRIGQFFTSLETAQYMASMFDFTALPQDISVLDPGSGTGILSAALVEYLGKVGTVHSIFLTCYETDAEVLPLLRNNLEYIRDNTNIVLNYRIIEKDYILSQSENFNHSLYAANIEQYDIVIGNPPYLRVLKDNPAAVAMQRVVHGAPNLYFLFASMSLFNLKHNGEMVYIIPRSWTSGAYFKAFRDYLLTDGKLEHIHLFVSRDKVFSQEQVLQETIIIKVRKTFHEPNAILLTSSNSNSDFENISQITLPYNAVVSGEDKYVFLPTTDKEMEIIQTVNQFHQTLPDIGLRMRTGIVVDFRQYGQLRKQSDKNTVPLFYSQHIKNGRVNHLPSGKDYDWIIDSYPGLIQKNKNYVFCKRFTAKEEQRRLQAGIYLASDYPKFKQIGTQNKINFVDKVDGGEMTLNETFGIYALLNSTLFDRYYRILNGSTQVNSTEINTIPVPPLNVIKEVGRRLQCVNDLSTEQCDSILSEVVYGQA